MQGTNESHSDPPKLGTPPKLEALTVMIICIHMFLFLHIFFHIFQIWMDVKPREKLSTTQDVDQIISIDLHSKVSNNSFIFYTSLM